MGTKSGNSNTGAWQQGAQASRNSWVQMDPITAQQRPTSWYVGQQSLPQYNVNIQPSAPLMSPPMRPLPSTSSFSGSTSKQSFGSSSNTSGTYETPTLANQPALQWPQLPPLQSHSNQFTSHSSITMDVSAKNEQKLHPYTHSRSRSMPYSVPQPSPHTQPNATTLSEKEPESLFVFGTVASTFVKQQQQQPHRPAQHASRASMDADSFQRLSSAIDTGQSLLLTKKFVPPKASNNPFESAIEDSPKREPSSLNCSPFADQSSNDSDIAALPASVVGGITGGYECGQHEEHAGASPWLSISGTNNHPNKEHVYPPPVPPQATKPAFLKYSRNLPPSSLRRTQSYGARAFNSTSGMSLDPFNTSSGLDTPPFTTPTTNNTLYTTSNNSNNVNASEFSHGNKLFRHKSDGSSLMRR
ncbi:hypothetical protein BX666DRAFT_1040841 [Dichotomocladium elegans]|nr:hypothetical protein BX666DRAFT_1040841 [Dichotomocladium elegans]